MKKLKFWLISVFSERSKNILGNVSAVVQLETEISSQKMQLIANELNQPATTFIWKTDEKWNIRWFAPDSEIQLCGHGAMAAVALFDTLNEPIPIFHYSNGEVSGKTSGSKIYSRLAKGSFSKTLAPEGLENALGVKVLEYFETNDKNIVVLKSESDLRDMQPNFEILKQLPPFGYAVTAKGDEVDFVSRTLVPKVLQLEDHATGSSHTVLVPYWSEQLNKIELKSIQLSRRGGSFECTLVGDLVVLSGDYEVIGRGEILI
ncbi:MAG: PhzF family phenazine biosynthesis protein [Brumimicrobium sp.]